MPVYELPSKEDLNVKSEKSCRSSFRNRSKINMKEGLAQTENGFSGQYFPVCGEILVE